jgi:ribosomal protein L2
MKLSHFRSIPSLRKGFSQKAGRNSTGKMTTRHRGSGHKQAIRQID